MKRIKIEDSASGAKALWKAIETYAGAHKHGADTLDIVTAAETAEDRLESMAVPKKLRSGAKFVSLSGTDLPNKYGHSPIRHRFEIVRGTSSWYLTEIVTVHDAPTKLPRPVIVISSAAADASFAALLRKHRAEVAE